MEKSKAKVVHPGVVLAKELSKRKIPAWMAAQLLDISCNAITRILKCEHRITPVLSIRFSMAFETTAKYWLDLQNEYDLWLVKKKLYVPQIIPFSQVPAEAKKIPIVAFRKATRLLAKDILPKYPKPYSNKPKYFQTRWALKSKTYG